MKKTEKRHIAGIAAVVLAGAIAAALLLKGGHRQPGNAAHEEAGHASATEAAESDLKGPHGGRLLRDRDATLEVSIVEEGGEPVFRAWLSENGAAAAGTLSARVERLGRAPQQVAFARQQEQYQGSVVLEEPHSFKVALQAQVAGRPYRFAFEQVEARVVMDAAQLKRSGVDVHTAGPASIRTVLHLSGEVRANDERQVHVVPRLAGLVERVLASTGDKVSKGQLLAVLSSAALADQRADLMAAQRRRELAQQTFERERQLWQERISAEQDYLQARHALQEADIALRAAQDKMASLGASGGVQGLARYELRAPIDGVVAMRHISPGEAVKEDTPVFTVVDMAQLWVDVTVPVRDLAAVQRGQQVTVRGTSFDASGAGTVANVDPLVGEESRTAKARVLLANKEGWWRPGMPVQVELVPAEQTVAVAVQNDAIQELDSRKVAFGRYGDAFEARPLRLGRSDGQYTEVLSGLQAGERYAAKNSFLLKAELGKSAASHEH